MTVLRDLVASTMAAHWRPEGYTVPNAATYPFRWLWDSAFHSLVWLALGDADRAVAELGFTLSVQEPDGFVPHVHYAGAPAHHAGFWGREATSTIGQPPIYGHAVAELRRAGVAVPGEVEERARAGVRWWFGPRRHRTGLIAARHPWETGCDDSPRFDHWGAADAARWYGVKGSLVRSGGDGFDCAPAGLSALVAWNAAEIGGLETEAADLSGALAARWDAERRCWTDAGDAAGGSGRARTLEGLLPLLVDPRPEPLADLADPAAWAGRFGPRGTHPGEPAYEPGRYWRGGVWPQLAYLLWRAGAGVVTAPAVAGALASGLAEYWHPDTGEPLGARPQSWTGLALLMAAEPPGPPGDRCVPVRL